MARTRSVPITSVKIPKGRRPLGDITELATSISNVGLLHPITLTEDLRLVAGLHRLEACRSLGWTRIPATVVTLSKLEVQLVEIDENVARSELTALELAEQLRRRKQIHEALHPETRSVTVRGGPGRGRKTSAKLATVSFADDAASKAGTSPRTVRRSVQLAESLHPDIPALLRKHPIADNQRQLLHLASLDRAVQVRVAKRLAGNANLTLSRAAELVLRRPKTHGRSSGSTKTPATRLLHGDALEHLQQMPTESVQCCATSPPFWQLVDYRVRGQLGQEPTPSKYVEKLVAVFDEVHRVLRKDGTLWLNLGDTYLARDVDTLKKKSLVGIPWRVALALQDSGWLLRSDIVLAKQCPNPENVSDRPTQAHEYLFLLSKAARYYYDADALREEPATPIDGRGSTGERRTNGHPARYGRSGARATGKWYVPSMSAPAGGRNRRSVWTVGAYHAKEGHPAPMHPEIVRLCVAAGSRSGDVVLDPFAGSGTTLVVAQELGRGSIGIELSKRFVKMATRRLGI